MMTEAEFAILYFFQSFHTPWLDEFMKLVTSLGNGGIFWILTGASLMCFKRTRTAGFCLLLSLAAGFLVGNVFMKNLAGRSRPCWLDDTVALLIKNPEDYSFPSGHTLASFEGAVTVWFYNKRWGSAAIVLAVLIGISRMYLFVHFPTDVLAGMVLGILIAWMVHRLVEGRYKKNFAFL